MRLRTLGPVVQKLCFLRTAKDILDARARNLDIIVVRSLPSIPVPSEALNSMTPGRRVRGKLVKPIQALMFSSFYMAHSPLRPMSGPMTPFSRATYFMLCTFQFPPLVCLSFTIWVCSLLLICLTFITWMCSSLLMCLSFVIWVCSRS